MMFMVQKKIKRILFLSFLLSFQVTFASVKKAKSLLKEGLYAESASLFLKELKSRRIKSSKERILLHYGVASALKSLDLNISSLEFYKWIYEKGPQDNPYFLKTFKALHSIYKTLEMEDTLFSNFVGQLNLNASKLPESLRGFYLYLKGKHLFDREEYKSALKYFSSVSNLDPLFEKALFYKGVSLNLTGSLKESAEAFEILLAEIEGASDLENMRDQTILNLARVYYENQNFEEAITSYGSLSKNSPFWLDALFEGAWTFTWLKNPNNTLGNLHTVLSPFYVKRFYPEAHILRTISLFKLCYYDEVKTLLKDFSEHFGPDEEKLKKLLVKLERMPGEAFSYVRDRDSNSSMNMAFVIDKSRRLTAYKKTLLFLEDFEVEQKEVSLNFDSPIREEFFKSMTQIKNEVIKITDKKIIARVRGALDELKDMFEQLTLIEADHLLIGIARIKEELNLVRASGEEEFIGGMQKLVLGQALEYWPYDGEYWKDELGGYVYNIPNLCRQ